MFLCEILGSSYCSYRGHSSCVSNIRFSCDGKHVISIGSTDKSIFQWKFLPEKEETPEVKQGDKQLIVDLPLEIEPLLKAEEIKSEEERDKRKRLEREVVQSQPKDFVITKDMVLLLKS